MKFYIFTFILIIYTTNIFAALPPDVQENKDRDTLLRYVNSHPAIKKTNYTIDTYSYTITYPKAYKTCTLTFEREKVFHFPGWVGPASNLVLDEEECVIKEVVGDDY